MEGNLVSRHMLDASHYEGKGKWKGVIQGWIVFLVIFIATLIPAVRQALLGFADPVKSVEWVVTSVHFLLNGFWIIAVFMAIGTLMKWREKQPFEEICIYEDGIGFVTVLGRQEKVNFDQVYVHYGAYQKSVYIDCALLGISAKNIPWNYFSQPDVLHKNLQRYANWNIGKYKKK